MAKKNKFLKKLLVGVFAVITAVTILGCQPNPPTPGVVTILDGEYACVTEIGGESATTPSSATWVPNDLNDPAAGGTCTVHRNTILNNSLAIQNSFITLDARNSEGDDYLTILPGEFDDYGLAVMSEGEYESLVPTTGNVVKGLRINAENLGGVLNGGINVAGTEDLMLSEIEVFHGSSEVLQYGADLSDRPLKSLQVPQLWHRPQVPAVF